METLYIEHCIVLYKGLMYSLSTKFEHSLCKERSIFKSVLGFQALKPYEVSKKGPLEPFLNVLCLNHEAESP